VAWLPANAIAGDLRENENHRMVLGAGRSRISQHIGLPAGVISIIWESAKYQLAKSFLKVRLSIMISTDSHRLLQ
jgi:hypothetical protein